MSGRTARAVALVLALAMVGGAGAAVAQIAATLALSPQAGPPGASVAASGVFGGHCGVRLSWDAVGGPVLGQASVGPDGNYATSIVVPGNATAGAHAVYAVGLAPDPDAACALETGAVASQSFEVTASGGNVTAMLALPSPQASPGGGAILDAGGSVGDIVAFDFDLDGNGTYETSCSSPRALAVHNERGSQPVGLRVTSAGGAVSTDAAVLEIGGARVPPPPNPDGRRASPFETGTIVGTCVDDTLPDVDAIVAAWYCPQTVIVGVVEATFRKWGINPAAPDACFERKEEVLPGLHFDIKTTSFVAKKHSGGYAWQQNPVLVNGLEFAHPAGQTVRYHNDVAINETFQVLYSYGKKSPNAYHEWQLTVLAAAGHRTSAASEPFLWPGAWDISDPGVIGHFTFGSNVKGPTIVRNELLGLDVAVKQTPIWFTVGLAKLTLHVSPPFWDFTGVELPTSAVEIFTENNGGHPTAAPIGSLKPRHGSAAPPEFDLQFTGIKLGMFTMNASLSYHQEGEDDVWSGGMDLFFPGGKKVGGTLVIRNGDFESAHFDYEPGPPGIGPIGCCVWIYELFGDLTTTSISAGADFGIGPEIPVIEVPPAQVTGEASIFYGDPWAFVLDVSNLKIIGIDVNANANVFISSNGFVALAFIDENWGPLELQANVLVKMGKGTWFAGGGGTVCVDIEIAEGCGGGYAGVGKDGLAACAKIPAFPDAGVTLHWKFFKGDVLAWDPWWGCSFGEVESAASLAALTRARSLAPDGLARVPVRVEPKQTKALFAIRGDGAAPKVTLTGPDGVVIASSATEPLSSGPGWSLMELPHDDTTYVVVERPAGGTWEVQEQMGSAPIASIELAEGHPQRVARATITGRGRTRTLHYDVADVDGVRVTFVERGGSLDSPDPQDHVERIIKTVGAGEGDLRFVPAESPVRNRTIEAQIIVDGIVAETEEVASFVAPRLRRLPAPDVDVVRRGGTLLVHWSRVPGAMAYRLVVDRSDGPTDVLDVSGLRARLAGITPRTTAMITVQAFSPGGYFGQVARTTVRSPLG